MFYLSGSPVFIWRGPQHQVSACAASGPCIPLLNWHVGFCKKNRERSHFTRIYMIYIKHMNESCHIYAGLCLHSWIGRWISVGKWVMSHIHMSHVTHMNKSCLKCVGSWIPLANLQVGFLWERSHVTHIYQLCQTYEWVKSHICSALHSNLAEAGYWSYIPSWGKKKLILLQVGFYREISHITHIHESCHKYL